jgi:hypothetical protein
MRSRLSRLLLSDSHVTPKFFSEDSVSSSEAGERTQTNLTNLTN